MYGSFSLQIMESADIFEGDWASCVYRPLEIAEYWKLMKLTFLLKPIGWWCVFIVCHSHVLYKFDDCIFSGIVSSLSRNTFLQYHTARCGGIPVLVFNSK